MKPCRGFFSEKGGDAAAAPEKGTDAVVACRAKAVYQFCRQQCLQADWITPAKASALLGW